MKNYGPAIFFGLCLALGFSVATQSWNGLLYVYMGEQRSPAAVRMFRDYSAMDRKALYQSVHQQLLAQASIIKQEGYVGVNLGHPLIKRAQGGGDFACPVQGRTGIFDRVELTWVGVGISDSGNIPVMSVESACLPGQSLNQLATIWIPMHDIVNAPAVDQEVQLYAGNQPIHVKLEAIPGQWPEEWALTKVRLFNEKNPDDSFEINSASIREVNPKLLSFDYK